MGRTITNAEAEQHLQSPPRRFAHRTDTATMREVSRKSHDARDRALKLAEKMTPADAVSVAQTLLVHVYADGIDYGDFQSAQAVEKYVGQAIRALRGLSLS